MTTFVDALDMKRILVVGSGAMGSQIAMVCALGGYEVSLHDVDSERLSVAERALRARIDRRVAKGSLSEADRDAAFERLSLTTDLGGAADVDLVIEAIPEILAQKRDLFAELDRVCPPRTILASNSSSFIPSRMADATERPDRFVNIHFFNPALVMRCVEVIRAPLTSERTAATAIEFVRRLEKEPVVMKKEINGFIANRIVNAIRDEAIFLYEGGYASIPDIDLASRTALGHPMGPFELQDLTGLDVGYAIKAGRFEESGDPADAPSSALASRVQAGHLGRKAGRGWYLYAPDGTRLGAAPSP